MWWSFVEKPSTPHLVQVVDEIPMWVDLVFFVSVTREFHLVPTQRQQNCSIPKLWYLSLAPIGRYPCDFPMVEAACTRIYISQAWQSRFKASIKPNIGARTGADVVNGGLVLTGRRGEDLKSIGVDGTLRRCRRRPIHRRKARTRCYPSWSEAGVKLPVGQGRAAALPWFFANIFRWVSLFWIFWVVIHQKRTSYDKVMPVLVNTMQNWLRNKKWPR
jgi:hypothetical protein